MLANITTTAEALAYFDSLPAVPAEHMLGRWRGEGLPTDHPLDGLLEDFNWYGKRFGGPDDVDPLLFRTQNGDIVAMNSRYLPAGLLARVRRDDPVVRLSRSLMPIGFALLRTARPTARLRMMEHRGVVTATMIYDYLPIHDVFRAVDANTRLGLMDLRGMERPFFFVLRKEEVLS